MSRIRFSMTSAMVAVALFALTFAGLRAEATIWTKILFMAVFFAMVLSILCVVYSGGERRAFCVGFALLGWGFLLYAYVLPSFPSIADKSFLAHEFASILQPKLQSQVTVNTPATPPGMGMPGNSPGMSMMGGGLSGAGATGTMWVGPSFDQVLTVCNAWLTILFAIGGGFVAQYLANRNARAVVRKSD